MPIIQNYVVAASPTYLAMAITAYLLKNHQYEEPLSASLSRNRDHRAIA